MDLRNPTGRISVESIELKEEGLKDEGHQKFILPMPQKLVWILALRTVLSDDVLSCTQPLKYQRPKIHETLPLEKLRTGRRVPS